MRLVEIVTAAIVKNKGGAFSAPPIGWFLLQLSLTTHDDLVIDVLHPSDTADHSLNLRL